MKFVHFLGKKWFGRSRLVSCGFGLLTILLCSPAFAQEPSAVPGEEFPKYPVIEYGTGTQADLIKQGEYLTKAGDCIACHTNGSKGKVFAGGLPIRTPFGTIYSPNITSDKQTGIGNWTDAQFIKAMREGVAPDGSYYFPVFPYPNFSKLTTQDVLAIRAYLNAIPAINEPNQSPYMPYPFRWRFLQIFWRLLYFDFDKGVFVPDTRRADDWNRGAYLVQGLGHCGMCHTPLNFLGAQKKTYAYTGGFVDGYYAPNISATGLRNVSVDDVVNVFLKDKLIGGGNVQGPMLEVNHDSLKYLNHSDLAAMATYLKTVESKQPPTSKTNTKVSLAIGKTIYNKYCVGCHGTGAGGAPKMGDDVAWAPRIKQGINILYNHAISGIGSMPPKGTCATCSTADIQSAVEYIVSQSKGTGGTAAQTKVAPPPTSLTDGKRVYNEVCSACHNSGKLGAPILGNKAAWTPIVKDNMDVLFTRAIDGYKQHPPRGSCNNCSDADIIAAVKYMVQQSKTSGDYRLW